MSGARPETPEELHMLAGEYVLGVLGSAEMGAVDERAPVDPQLAHAIAGWERRFAPMLTAVAAVAPPDGLWARIEHAKAQAVDGRQRATAPPRLTVVPSTAAPPPAEPAWQRPAATRRIWPWKAATGASLALAAGLAAFMLMPPMPGGRDVAFVALLAQPESPAAPHQDASAQMASDTGLARLVEPQPASSTESAPEAARMTGFLVAVWPDGTVVLTALSPVPLPGGKTLELWIQPPGATAPKSVGKLAAAGQQTTLPAMPVDGTSLSISLEPLGGSPTGAPTGRVVYAGTLRQVRR